MIKHNVADAQDTSRSQAVDMGEEILVSCHRHCMRTKNSRFLAAPSHMCKKNAALLVPSRLAKPAQQQVERARASIPRLRRRHRKDVPPQPRLFEPPRYRSLEDP